ncbi:monoamine oxidase [Sphingomonas naasensis]|uniref:NAD(P)/FAD-dependent oxidoreductase n=1 Tax=Sphingomonas naasensis TaxID=1344951 RepID=A0A4S1W9V1_9SPHN|nr:NAD(P)/FAD-dependent oxidoreductase [Sphingomonas naasensis]NIJ21210.1 monoamine oxidase [Sphingomonas naasensis]TGX38655.1 NAD(P)/FAD-dependent oxidoreductase [Sphingomonas naasensis]
MRGSNTVWRALAVARARNAAAAGEAMPIPGAPGPTRRALIKGIAAAGMASALPRPAHAFAGGRVAIVGGGIAGLSALHHLREAGIDAHVYEGRSRTGGRMFTHRPANGPWFEVGGQLVNTDHDDMHKLCARFGVKLVDRKAEPHRTLILGDGRLLGEAELAEALRPIAAQIDRDSARLDKDFDRVAAEIDRMSIAGYLDKHRGLIGKPWIRELLEATSRTEYGVEPEHASAVELVFNLPTVKGHRIEVLGESDERFVMEGGSSSLIEAMTAHYADRITTGKRLARVESAHGGVRLGFHDGSIEAAETVIVAVPAPLLRQIDWRVPLPPVWRAFIAEMALGHNEKVQAATATTPWKPAMGVGGELWQTKAEAGWALGWDGSVHRAGDVVAPVWTWFLGGDEVTRTAAEAPSASSARYAASAAPAIPGLEAAAGPFARTNWHAQALTLGAYVNFRPGQVTRFARLLCVDSDDLAERHVPSAGRIFFAGEHLSEAYPGYMNGGAETGRVVAEAISGRRRLERAA